MSRVGKEAAGLSGGAAHARLVVRTLLKTFCQQVEGIEILGTVPKCEREPQYVRQYAFESLFVRFEPRAGSGGLAASST